MKKKLLITGAFGLVGSNICKILERDYPEIEVYKEKGGLRFDSYPYHFFDYIIHAAGYGQPQMFSKDKLATIKLNTVELDNLFHMLAGENKFLFVSSSEVYSGAPSPHKETDIGTTTPQHPRACYIEGKRCGEAICMAYKEQGYDVKIARLALAYGPGTKKGDTRVLNQFIEQALTTGAINIKTDGSEKRTYLYVEDAAEMLLDILFKGKDVVYNVGGDSINTTTIAQLASMIFAQLRKNGVLNRTNIKNTESPNEVILDMTKTNNEFFRLYTNMASGLGRTIEYQKELYDVK